MKGNVIIRDYTVSDHAACIEIFSSNTPGFFDPSELSDLENWLSGKDEGKHSYVRNKEERFFVVESNGKVLACGGFYVPQDEDRANMVWGMVHNDHHKQGLGKQLLTYRMKLVEEMYPGYAISLDTTQHTQMFFQNLGFELTKVQKDFYGPGLDRYDMVRN